MTNYRVLVVDDSALMRLEIRRLIEKDEALSVAGMAANGEEAIRMARELRPDVITLDVEMRGMNGIDTLHALMRDSVLPVIMLASQTRYSQSASIQAMDAGAIDFFLKETVLYKGASEENIQDFLLRLKTAAAANMKASPARQMGASSAPPSKSRPITTPLAAPAISPTPAPAPDSAKSLPPVEINRAGGGQVELVAIGSSTGGPNAIHQVLKGLPADLPVPVIIAQHMPPGFTQPFSEHLDQAVPLRVQEAVDGTQLRTGHVYICPSGSQSTIRKDKSGNLFVQVWTNEADKALYKPSVNTLFTSVASEVKDRVVAVILTGMGSDGLLGCQAIHAEGGRIIAESRETAVIYGMPRVVTEAGIADVSAKLPDVAAEILNRI